METKNREKFLSRAVINKFLKNVLSYLSNRMDENLRNVELFRIIRSNFSYRKNWSRDPHVYCSFETRTRDVSRNWRI